ncbi:MAG: GNAT family N-acetyltransferase [Hyphomicrobiaceae bacterium]|nr:GNAT family N-acetyltransferase [Hyphomicrobiaceae bacterium]
MTAAIFRSAREEDLADIVALLVDDPLGATRESGDGELAPYIEAFREIDADPNNLVVVAEDEGRVVGCLQVTFIANLSFEGGRRALIEAVRVADSHQGRGLGRAIMEHAVELAKGRGCRMVQLTSNKQRPDAIKFYERLGFQRTHEGFKLYL